MVFDPNVFDSDVFDGGVTASAELASGTGSAFGASVLVAPNAGSSTGTGTAYDATVSTAFAAFAGLASGTGAAGAASASIAPGAGAASGTGTAYDATFSIPGAERVFDPNVFDFTVFDTGTNTGVAPEVASGTGTALGASVHVQPNAGLVSGSGAASDATISTNAPANASAEAATGTGSAYDATVDYAIRANAGAATGTGIGHQPRIAIAPRAGTRNGAGAAYDATVAAIDSYDTIEQDIATGYMPPLAAPIDDNDTTITVTTPSNTTSNVPFLVVIDDEQVLVTTVVGTTWTVERGYNGTTAAAHGAGTLARPALVRITVGGVDITADVSYQRSRFATGANGQAGLAEIWVRDIHRTHSFVTGAEIRVSFRGIYQWGGYLTAIRRQYVFESGTGNVGDEPRWMLLDAVDYNVLLNKRIYRLASDETFMKVKHWPNSTWDSVVIDEVVHSYLNLGSAGLTYDINHVGTPALTQISCDPNAPDTFGVGSAGWTWGDVMASIASQTGAVYYIDPDKVFRYVDDATKQSRFGWDGVSDIPDTTEDATDLVSTTVRDDFTRTVIGGWGTGDLGVWTQDGAGTVSVDGAEALTAGSSFFYQTVPLDVEIVDSDYKLIQIRFKLATSGNEAIGIEITAGSDYTAAYFNFFAAATDSIDLNTTGDSQSVNVPAFDRTRYGFFKLDVDKATGTTRSKVWNDGDSEPSWQITVTDAALVGADLSTVAIARDSSASTTARFDWVEATYDAVVVTPGSSLVGYRDIELTSDGTKLTNDHLQWGAGQGEDEMVFHRTTDDGSIASHGLWQTAEVRFDLYCQDSVDQRGNTWVYGSPQNHRGGKDDRFVTRFTVREPYFRCADVIIVKSHEFGITRTMPIRSAEITFPTPWDYRGVLTASHEIDAPWSTLEFWMPQFDFETPDLDIFNPVGPGPPDIPNPWGPHDGCEQVLGECVVFDEFGRTGSTLGTADSGHIWGDPVGVTNTYTPTTDGSQAVLQVEAGFTAGAETTHVGSGRLNLSTEGELFVPMTARFQFHYSGVWNSTYVENPVLEGADPSRRWAPGYAPPGVETNIAGAFGGDSYRRDFLQVAVSASIPIYRFNVFNAAGHLYAAARDPNVVNDETNGAVLIGPQLEPGAVCNVWVHLDSDRVYLKVWPEGSAMPSYYQVQSEVAGSTWADQEFLIFSRAQVKDDFQQPFTMYVDDLCIARTTYAGEGLPGFGVASVAEDATFTDNQNNSRRVTYTPGTNTTVVATGLGSGDVDGIGQYLNQAPTLGTAAHEIKWFLTYFEDYATLSGGRLRMRAAWTSTTNPSGAPPTTVSLEVYKDATSGMPAVGSSSGTIAGWTGGTHLGTLTFTADEGGPPGSGVFYRSSGFQSAVTGELALGGSSSTQVIRLETTESFPGLSITPFYNSSYSSNGIGTLRGAEITQNTVLSGPDGTPCADLAPGESSDPIRDGPNVGEGADSTFEVGDNGGIIFHTDEQFQLASTEVWVNGLRIRLGEDYLEYPRQAMIEILDHIDVGTEEDPATVLVNYRIWTLDDPLVE